MLDTAFAPWASTKKEKKRKSRPSAAPFSAEIPSQWCDQFAMSPWRVRVDPEPEPMTAVVEQPRRFRRNDPGTKREDWNKWEPVPFDQMDSSLNVQQWIQQTIAKDPSNMDDILTPPADVDDGVWKYEHLRQVCLELNGLALLLQEDCDPTACVQMTATDQWIFLCANHKNPKECSAIDYTRHTLDGASTLLNNSKYFPSRINIKESSISKLGSVCRRVYRIFSHAYYHHRNIFDAFEERTHLCMRFTSFVTRFEMMSNEHLIVPMLASQQPVIVNTGTSATIVATPGHDTSQITTESSA